ncbi:hypothetical protein JB92DRAFT_2868645 [Gautieria morchelliformis]|nr:hypothetical protein JB92DRAFT_2868645 [Gautieria morchelliformis]
MYSHSSARRTYTSRPRQRPCSPQTSPPPSSPSVDAGVKRKRVLLDCVSINSPSKRANTSDSIAPKPKPKPVTKPSIASRKSNNALKKPTTRPLTQLHFVVDSTLRTCPSCALSYIQGAIDDETLHKKHCARVQRGLEWGKEEEKEAYKAGVRVVEDFVRIKGHIDATHGRIIAIPAHVGGKIGAKLTSLLETIDLALSSPGLSPRTLKISKAYFLLLPSPSGRERIAGCVIAQQIFSAMNVVATPPLDAAADQNKLVSVEGGLYCSPELHPTPLGIPRLFVPSKHRRQGIAKLLLTAAAKTFVHGCELDPTKGQVAFSQPTGDGRKVMENWGKGGIRIYED